MALQVSVPAFPVADIAAATAFYTSKLGFQVKHEEAGFALLGREAVSLTLWQASDNSWPRRWRRRPVVSGAESFLAGTASCRIQCDAVDDHYAAFLAQGVVHPNGALEAKPWGTQEFAVLDLDGNLITFFQPD